MRLLNTETLQIETFPPGRIPGYDILSHTWGDEEVTLQEMRNLDLQTLTNKKGYAKIRSVCVQARVNRTKYIWIDTCCSKTIFNSLSIDNL
jgi:hypothetical protein